MGKYASDTTQWVENGLEIFLGILDQYSSMRVFIRGFLATTGSATAYPNALRRVSYFDAVTSKRLGMVASLYQILQILSLTLFEKTPVLLALQIADSSNDLGDICNQLILLDF